MSSSAHATGSCCSTQIAEERRVDGDGGGGVEIAAGRRPSGTQRADSASSSAEPRVGLALARTVPQREHVGLASGEVTGVRGAGRRRPRPDATSCSSANWRMVSSIENRVRPDERSATSSDLRTSASSTSSVANSSSEPATAHAPAGRIRRRTPNTVASSDLLVVVEQVVGPLHRVAQRLVALQPAPRPDQQPEPVVEAIAHLDRGHRLHPRGGQLDRQRDAVEAAADLGDGARLVSTVNEIPAPRAGALDEQRRGRRCDRVDVQGGHGPELFVGHPQSLPAGGEDLHGRRLRRGSPRSCRRRRRARVRSCRRPAAAMRPSNAAATLSARLSPGCCVMPSTAATASGTAAGSPTAASSITHTPSGKSVATRAPRPPGPAGSCPPRRHRSTSPADGALSAVCSSASSASRPTKLVVGGRRFPGVGVERLSAAGNRCADPAART